MAQRDSWVKAASLVFGTWLIVSLLLFLGEPLRVGNKGSTLLRVWNVSATIVEALARKCAILLGLPVPFDTKIQRLKEYCQTKHREWRIRIARQEYYSALRRKKITYEQCQLLLESFAEWNSNTEHEEGVLPGDLDEAEAFLQVAIEGRITANEKSNEQCKLGAFHELAELVEKRLAFSVGDRVLVKDGDDSGSSGLRPNGEIALANFDRRKGSVVEVFSANNMVLFDGQRSPLLVSTSACQLLNAHDELSDDEVSVNPETAEPIHSAFEFETEAADADKESQEGSSSDGVEDGEAKVREDCHQRKRKARTVEEALQEGGWQLIRKKKHLRFRRLIVTSDGKPSEQHFTMAKTSSDCRAGMNALSTLSKLNEAGAPMQDKSASSGRILCCTICGLPQPDSAFSKNQVKKGTLKCKTCVERC